MLLTQQLGVIRCGDVIPLACVANVSLPFPGREIEQASRRAGEREGRRAKERACGGGKSGRSREGVSEKGAGRKGIACSQSQRFY